MKTCRKCGCEKAEEEFHQSRQRRDGLQSWCKGCMNAYQRNMRPTRPSSEAAPVAAPEAGRPAGKPPRRFHSFAHDLGGGRLVQFFNIPADLTRREADKLERLIWAYVDPEDLPPPQSPRPRESSGTDVR